MRAVLVNPALRLPIYQSGGSCDCIRQEALSCGRFPHCRPAFSLSGVRHLTGSAPGGSPWSGGCPGEVPDRRFFLGRLLRACLPPGRRRAAACARLPQALRPSAHVLHRTLHHLEPALSRPFEIHVRAAPASSRLIRDGPVRASALPSPCPGDHLSLHPAVRDPHRCFDEPVGRRADCRCSPGGKRGGGGPGSRRGAE